MRVLAVRLQGIGYGDPRRGVIGYYDLARDARKEIIKTSGEGRTIWKEKLEDLGVRVGNALVEMGDSAGALRHFNSLRRPDGSGDKQPNGRLALLCLRLGDVVTARKYIEAGEDINGNAAALRPLLSMAEGRYDMAVEGFRTLLESSNSEITMQNLAVCLLYIGKIEEVGIPLLPPFVPYGLTMNLLPPKRQFRFSRRLLPPATRSTPLLSTWLLCTSFPLSRLTQRKSHYQKKLRGL